jgi:hypothetical protein
MILSTVLSGKKPLDYFAVSHRDVTLEVKEGTDEQLIMATHL